MFFLIDDLGSKLQGRSHVLRRDAVLLLDLLKSHPAGQPADNPRRRDWAMVF